MHPSIPREPMSARAALELFDSLEPVPAEFMLGRWRGHEVHTGHPLDGGLSAGGWYGKHFFDVDDVHPLLHWASGGRALISVSPSRVPFPRKALPATLVRGGRFMLHAARTREPSARLRAIEHRGAVTAAMVYDERPIIDFFRKFDDRCVLGLMDRRGMEPLYFALERDDDAPLRLHYLR